MKFRLLLIIGIAILLPGCLLSNGKAIQMYKGDNLTKDNVAIIEGDKHIRIIKVDDQEVSENGKTAKTVAVLPGTHKLEVFYNVFSHGGGIIPNLANAVTASKSKLTIRTVRFEAQAGRKYILKKILINGNSFTGHYDDITYKVLDKGNWHRVKAEVINNKEPNYYFDLSESSEKGSLFLKVNLKGGFSDTKVYINIDGHESLAVDGWCHVKIDLDVGSYNFAVTTRKPKSLLPLKEINSTNLLINKGAITEYEYRGSFSVYSQGTLTKKIN